MVGARLSPTLINAAAWRRRMVGSCQDGGRRWARGWGPTSRQRTNRTGRTWAIIRTVRQIRSGRAVDKGPNLKGPKGQRGSDATIRRIRQIRSGRAVDVGKGCLQWGISGRGCVHPWSPATPLVPSLSGSQSAGQNAHRPEFSGTTGRVGSRKSLPGNHERSSDQRRPELELRFVCFQVFLTQVVAAELLMPS
jgi:hypothetical protein